MEGLKLASGSAGSIFVDLLLRDAQYKEGMKRNKAATSDFAKGVKELARDLAPLIGGAGFTALASKALSSADAISKAAKTAGLSAEEFQRFGAALKLGGVEQEAFTSAIIKLNNNLAEGNLPYKSTSEALLGIADRLKNAKDGIERARIASQAFGAKVGATLIPALQGGRAEILKLGQQAEELGLVFSDQLVADAEEFQDQIEILGDVVTKNFQAGLLAGFVSESQTIKDIYSDPSFIQGVKDIGAAFGELAGFVVTSVKAFQEAKTALAALGIEIAARANFIDRDIADEALLEASDRLNGIKAPLKGGISSATGSGDGGGFGPTPKELKERADALDNIFDSLNKQTVLLQIQNDSFGESKEAIDGMVRARELMFDLEEKGIVLSEKERANIQQKLTALQAEKELQADLKEADEARVEAQKQILDRQEEERKRIEDSIQDIKRDLASEITDAIKGAQSLGDAFKNVAAKIAEAVTQAQLLKLLSSAGLGGEGESGGGFFGSLFKGGGIFEGLLSSFDIGTPFVPRDQVAMVHKGEMIIPRVQADRMRNGGMGGMTINQYINTPDANSFQRSQNQILATTQQTMTRASRRNN